MNTFIKCLKLIKYGTQVKTQLIFMAIFAAIGIFFEFFSDSNTMLGGFYIFLLPVILGQLLTTLSISGLVQSSPLKKKLQTVFPYMVSTPFMALSLLIIIAHRAFMLHTGVEGMTDAENYTMQSAYVMQLGIMIFLALIYFAFAYKFFLVAMIVFVLFTVPSISILSNPFFGAYYFIGQNFTVSVIVAISLFIIGNILSFIFTGLCYKYDISKYMTRRMLGKMA